MARPLLVSRRTGGILPMRLKHVTLLCRGTVWPRHLWVWGIKPRGTWAVYYQPGLKALWDRRRVIDGVYADG